jgi:hypothetical protein
MVEGDFGEAYRRADRVFQGQMQQNFVVLRDWMNAPSQESFSSIPRKREEEGQTQFSKRGAGGGLGKK